MKQGRMNLITTKRFNRRRFLRLGAATAGMLIVPGSVAGVRFARGKSEEPAPNEKLNIAAVGLGARGLGNVEKCEGTNIVALCDVDAKLSRVALDQYPGATHYHDFRKMLDTEKSIDGVIISTPDHTHAVIAAAAMKRHKHVFVETPLAHDVAEVRELQRLAQETKVATQMGNERHSGPGIRRAVEMLWGGGLGPIRQVFCWSNRPQWPQGIERPEEKPKTPSGLDWDLWLGPAPERAFHAAYHPYRWRGWQDFGTGALGAMGCHLLDVVFWGLKLGEAKSFSVQAQSTPVNRDTYPKASTICYRFPARGDLPSVEVTWLDGGRRPTDPQHLPYLREIGSNGTLFVGDEHSMMFGPTVFGTTPSQVGPRTIPEFAEIEAKQRVPRIPPVKDLDWKNGNRHIQEWLSACKAGKQPCANFEYSAALTEMVLLGNVALLNGEPIEWDSQAMRVTNSSRSNRFLRRDYRPGWSL